MRRKKVAQWTAVGIAALALILVLGWRLTGCASSGPVNITYTIALDTSQRTAANYGRYLPVTVLIDDQGIIRDIKIGAFRSKGDVVNWLDDITGRESTPPLDGVRPAVGYAAPDFSLPTLEGGTVELSQLRGKWVLVNFWATWCPHCVAQEPYLQAAYEERGAEIEFIGINVGESEQKVREHIKG